MREKNVTAAVGYLFVAFLSSVLTARRTKSLLRSLNRSLIL